jgi:hypothetical protein
LLAAIAGCGGGGGSGTNPEQNPPPSSAAAQIVLTLTPADPDVLVKVVEKGAATGEEVAASGGTYTFDAPHAGTYVLSLAGRDGKKPHLDCDIDPTQASASIEEAVADGQTLRLAFAPRCSQRVGGVVTDPFVNPAGIMVHLVNVSDASWAPAETQVQTPPKGLPYYDFDGLPNGRYEVSFEPQSAGQHFEPGTQHVDVSYDDAAPADEVRQHQVARLYPTIGLYDGSKLTALAQPSKLTIRAVADRACSLADVEPSSCTSAHAVLSTSQSDDVAHLDVPADVVVLSETTLVAESWASFLSGNGVNSFGTWEYWTGTTSAGALSSDTCNWWSSEGHDDYGTYGSAGSPAKFLSRASRSCDQQLPLLCVCW